VDGCPGFLNRFVPMKRLCRFFRSLVSFLFVAVLTFWICDRLVPKMIVPGVVSQYRDLSHKIFYHPEPYVLYGTQPTAAMKRDADFNDLGFRGPIPALPKPVDEIRVFVFGGSTALVGDPPLSTLMDRHFRTAGSHIRVYNFGVVASITRMDLARLVFVAAKFRPDIVLLYGGGNDVVMPYQGDPRPGYPPNYSAFEHNPLLALGEEGSSFKTLAGLLLARSDILRITAPAFLSQYLLGMSDLQKSSGWGTPQWSAKLADEYVDDLLLTADVARGLGAEVIAVFQPLLYYKDRTAKEEQPWDLPDLHAHAELFRQRVRERTTGLKKTGLTWVDASDLFDGMTKQVFLDGIHIEQEEYSRVAEVLIRQVAAAVGNRPGEPGLQQTR
jgi:hypothetical protein